MRAPDAKRPGLLPQPGPAITNTLDRSPSSHESPRRDLVMSSYETRRPGVSRSHRRFLDLPASRAFGLPPVPGRTMWAVIVLTCAHCGSGHVHRSGDTGLVLSGKLIRRCPATREHYRLGPVQRRREARYTTRLAAVA